VPKLPSNAAYNDLTGTEARQILEQRIGMVLDQVPYFQKHLTLPRLRMRIQVEIVLNAESPGGTVIPISDDFTVTSESPDHPDAVITSDDVIDASPGPPRDGHKPPDQIRDEHGLERPPDRMSAVFDPRTAQRDLPPALPPTEIPGVRIERGSNLREGIRAGTLVTQDRGGPVMTGSTVEQPRFRNSDHGPTDPLDNDFRDSKRRP
jgi:hypothetical protein